MTGIIDIWAEIAELRAELSGTILTTKERARSAKRLDAALVEAERRRQAEEGA